MSHATGIHPPSNHPNEKPSSFEDGDLKSHDLENGTTHPEIEPRDIPAGVLKVEAAQAVWSKKSKYGLWFG